MLISLGFNFKTFVITSYDRLTFNFQIQDNFKSRITFKSLLNVFSINDMKLSASYSKVPNKRPLFSFFLSPLQGFQILKGYSNQGEGSIKRIIKTKRE